MDSVQAELEDSVGEGDSVETLSGVREQRYGKVDRDCCFVVEVVEEGGRGLGADKHLVEELVHTAWYACQVVNLPARECD